MRYTYYGNAKQKLQPQKVLFILLMTVLALFLALVPLLNSRAGAVPVNGSTALLAGQTIPVGNIDVTNDADTIYVKYSVNASGWCLTGIHLDVEGTKDDFPTAGGKTKNLVPGQFDFSKSLNCVNEYTQEVPMRPEWQSGEDVAIAAHADVEKRVTSCTPGTMTIVSDTQTMFGSGTAAVGAWVHPVWTTIDGATWIWTTNPVTADSARNGELVDFYRNFTVPGDVTSANLSIASDNTYDVDVNGVFVGKDLSEFNYNKVANFDITNKVTNGANKIEIQATNLAWNTDDPYTNPAGLLYKIDIAYQNCTTTTVQKESAWGAGTRYNTKGNWATYFTFKLQEVWSLLETVTVPANSTVTVETNSVLDATKQYKFVASGTANAGDTIDFDAICSITNRISGDTWTDTVTGYEGYGATLLELKVNGKFGTWGTTCNTDHLYTANISNYAGKATFIIYDVYPVNNTGSLNVDIYSKLY